MTNKLDCDQTCLTFKLQTYLSCTCNTFVTIIIKQKCLMADLLRQNILYLQRTRSLALLWHQPAPCPALPHQWFFSSSTCPVQSQSCFYTSTALLLFQILSTEGKSQHLINLWNMQPYFNSAFIHFYWKYSTMSKISSKIKKIYNHLRHLERCLKAHENDRMNISLYR